MDNSRVTTEKVWKLLEEENSREIMSKMREWFKLENILFDNIHQTSSCTADLTKSVRVLDFLKQLVRMKRLPESDFSGDVKCAYCGNKLMQNGECSSLTCVSHESKYELESITEQISKLWETDIKLSAEDEEKLNHLVNSCKSTKDIAKGIESLKKTYVANKKIRNIV